VKVSIPDTRRLALTSKLNGRRYSLSVGLPAGPRHSSGCPALYVLDSQLYFASAVGVVRSCVNSDVLVVGVECPERQYDLTLPASQDVLVAQNVRISRPLKPADVGGLEDFLRVLESEIKPCVRSRFAVDGANEALFGHSLGGLAVVHGLFTAPGSFRTFLASSPSLWWNRRAVLAGERRFSEAVVSGGATARFMASVGGDEEVPPRLPKSRGFDPKRLRTQVRRARMIANVRDLTARLQALRGVPPYEVADCAVFDNVGHALAAWPALARMIEFAFARTDGDR
jgi:predicted alpha/beta superfamily hydrolase